MTLVTEYILRVLLESYSLRITLILSVGIVFFTNLVIGCFEQRRRPAKAIANVRLRGNGLDNKQQHATGCVNRRNMYHPTMLRPFASSLKR